jgi:hypothetical protein
MSSIHRPLIALNNAKNERFKKQPKQTGPNNYEYNSGNFNKIYFILHTKEQDIIRGRKQNQSSLQMAANSIINDN